LLDGWTELLKPPARQQSRIRSGATVLDGKMALVPAPEDRPVDPTPVHTDDLPATPQRDRTIPATAWVEAPPELLELGRDLGHDLVAYKRRIGTWLLWRAGPATKGDARYAALAADDPRVRYTFRLFPSGGGEGLGPDGVVHDRFRAWKEALRDHPPRDLTGE
jgi:hypothetical protein